MMSQHKWGKTICCSTGEIEKINEKHRESSQVDKKAVVTNRKEAEGKIKGGPVIRQHINAREETD